MSFILVQEPAPAWERGAKSDECNPSAAPAPRAVKPAPPAGATSASQTPPTPASQPDAAPVAAPVRQSALQDRLRLRERRWSERSSIYRSGHVSLAISGKAVACTVLDISRFGALIQIAADTELTPAFLLVFTAGRIRSEADCLVRWREGERVGVSFIGPVRTFVAKDTH